MSFCCLWAGICFNYTVYDRAILPCPYLFYDVKITIFPKVYSLYARNASAIINVYNIILVKKSGCKHKMRSEKQSTSELTSEQLKHKNDKKSIVASKTAENHQDNRPSSGIRYSFAFTIVELLIVIVIIGILAAITIISYAGITQKANAATLQSELTNASKKLQLYYAEYNTYPTIVNLTTGCPTAPNPDNNHCLKLRSDVTYTYDGTNGTAYHLTATKGTLSYQVDNGKAPYSLETPATTPITAIGAITGTTATGQTLTAGAITPAAATVSYQWQSATTSDGIYTNINGATSSIYIVSPSQIGKYLKVTIAGTGSYGGTQTSTATAQVAADANWLTIGSQTWAKANLNVGIRVAGTTAQSNNGGTNIVEKYCYNNTEAGCTNTDAYGVPYGGLYQWDEAMGYTNTEGAQGICPAGSHIPSDNEWKILEMSIKDMTQAVADMEGWRGTVEGARLKSGGSSGLNLPLAGCRSNDGLFSSQSSSASLWSSSESNLSAWHRYLNSPSGGVSRTAINKGYGFSVRCLGN